MLRLCFFILLSIINFDLSIAQIEINYTHTIRSETSEYVASYNLIGDNQKSVYYKVDHELHGSSIDGGGRFTPFIEKKYDEKIMTGNFSVFSEVVNVRDKLPLQSWDLDYDESMCIGEYNCKKATTTFRGRDYIAWYTEDISYIGGPWKFDGLPGLILEVYSTDNKLSISAKDINLEKTTKTPVFKYKEKSLYSWEEYCELFREAYERKLKKLAAENDGFEYDINIDSVEEMGF